MGIHRDPQALAVFAPPPTPRQTLFTERVLTGRTLTFWVQRPKARLRSRGGAPGPAPWPMPSCLNQRHRAEGRLCLRKVGIGGDDAGEDLPLAAAEFQECRGGA